MQYRSKWSLSNNQAGSKITLQDNQMEQNNARVTPSYGWTCFHCGDTFITEKDARDHFGPTDGWTPECIDRSTSTVDSLLTRAREAEQAVEVAVRQRVEAEECLDSANSQLQQIKARFGVTSVTDAFWKYHSMEGRALAAEAFLTEIAKYDPEAVQSAKDRVCAPGHSIAV